MKNLFTTSFIMIFAAMMVSAQADYKQWEVHRFVAKSGHGMEFEKGLAAHNKKYHNTAPYKTGIFEIMTGPNTGAYELAMGSMTFTQMEGRPASDEHNADWAGVMEHAEPIGESVYWRAEEDVMYQPAGSENYTVFRWRYSTLYPGQYDRYVELMKDVAEVMKAKSYPSSFMVYYRWGASQGPHVCSELGMNSLAFFDGDRSWKKDFDEVHGEGAYDRFFEELGLCLDLSKTYDEVVKLRTDLSSDY
jgi:hypothetical protein